MTDPAEAAAGVPIAGPAVPNVYEAQVRWSDADIMGHVNHARYLSFFEDARMTLLATSPAGLASGPSRTGSLKLQQISNFLAEAAASVKTATTTHLCERSRVASGRARPAKPTQHRITAAI